MWAGTMAGTARLVGCLFSRSARLVIHPRTAAWMVMVAASVICAREERRWRKSAHKAAVDTVTTRVGRRLPTREEPRRGRGALVGAPCSWVRVTVLCCEHECSGRSVMGGRGVTASVGGWKTASAVAEARHIRVDGWVGSEGEDSDGVGAVTTRVGRSHGGGPYTSAPAPSIAATVLGGGAKPVVPVATRNGDTASEGGMVAKAEAEVVGRAREMMERMRRWLFGLRRPIVASTGALAPPVAPVQPVFLLYYTAKGGGLKGYSKAGHRNPDSQRSLSAAPAPTWQVVT